MRSVLVLALFSLQVSCLNILLSTTDSWVTKNIRLLQDELAKNNHTAIIVAPLHQSVNSLSKRSMLSDEPITGGGDFGHLLPSNQMFYKNLEKLERIRKLPPSPKRTLSKLNLQKIDEEIESEFSAGYDFNNTNQFGYDPLNRNCWYVNSNDPVDILSIATNNLLPKFYPGMDIDLAVVGPTEGSDKETQKVVLEMEKFLLTKNIPTVSASSADSSHMYFRNDLLSKKNNRFAKITKYQNSKIIELIENLQDKNHNILPYFHSINMKFPKYLDSNCKLQSTLKMSESKRLYLLSYNLFNLENNTLVIDKEVSASLVSKLELLESNASTQAQEDDEEERFFVNKDSNYYKYKMQIKSKPLNKIIFDSISDKEILDSCNIPINVNYLFEFDSSIDF